jgi:hypothetical protein
MGGEEVGLSIEDGVEATVAGKPSEQTLNGLITNDKFCLTRMGRLRLSWSRARSGLREAVVPQLFGDAIHRGGEHAAAEAASLGCSAHRCVDTNQPAALGPGLPAPPAVGGEFPRADKGAGVPDPAGGVPCE